jgi:hypothetical protein
MKSQIWKFFRTNIVALDTGTFYAHYLSRFVLSFTIALFTPSWSGSRSRRQFLEWRSATGSIYNRIPDMLGHFFPVGGLSEGLVRSGGRVSGPGKEAQGIQRGTTTFWHLVSNNIYSVPVPVIPYQDLEKKYKEYRDVPRPLDTLSVIFIQYRYPYQDLLKKHKEYREVPRPLNTLSVIVFIQ